MGNRIMTAIKKPLYSSQRPFCPISQIHRTLRGGNSHQMSLLNLNTCWRFLGNDWAKPVPLVEKNRQKNILEQSTRFCLPRKSYARNEIDPETYHPAVYTNKPNSLYIWNNNCNETTPCKNRTTTSYCK